MDKLLEYKSNWIQHVNRMPRDRLPRVMKRYSPTGRRNHGRPLKRLLDTWYRNGSRSGPTPWQIYDDDDDTECLYGCPGKWPTGCNTVAVKMRVVISKHFVLFLVYIDQVDIGHVVSTCKTFKNTRHVMICRHFLTSFYSYYPLTHTRSTILSLPSNYLTKILNVFSISPMDNSCPTSHPPCSVTLVSGEH